MAANSYLILGPARPSDIAAAAITQRQTIPFIWALAVASPTADFVSGSGLHYFATNVGDALAMLDRGQAAWNYNSYFRDTLAPVGAFRSWLANNPSETPLYVNFTELIGLAPDPAADLAELARLGEKVRKALDEIEEKHFSIFLQDLRKLSYPLVTVPITGDRELDLEILNVEIRDTSSPEAEMALQLVGVDRDGSLLRKATESIRLQKDKRESKTASDGGTTIRGEDKVLTLFTADLKEAEKLLVEGLGCTVVKNGQHRLLLNAKGEDLLLVQVEGE